MRRQLFRTFSNWRNRALLKECALLNKRTFTDQFFEKDDRVKRGERLADILLSQGNTIVSLYQFILNLGLKLID